MVLMVKGYRVVPQCLSGGTQGFRHVHLKEHNGSFKVTLPKKGGGNKDVVVAKGKTLFVGNVDDQGGRLCRKTIEERLRRALSSCGGIDFVRVSQAPDSEETRKGATLSRFAHVCFSSPKGVKRALALEELPSGALAGDAKVRMKDTEKEDDEDEAMTVDIETDNRDENGDETCGYAALLQRHRRQFPPRQELQVEVDSIMARFEEEEAAEDARRKAKLENPIDEDGFETVTYKRKRGRKNSLPSEESASSGNGAKPKKKRGAGELEDFYRFQMRETRREQLAALRSKFEQDKARVAKMKAQRKFKPF